MFLEQSHQLLTALQHLTGLFEPSATPTTAATTKRVRCPTHRRLPYAAPRFGHGPAGLGLDEI